MENENNRLTEIDERESNIFVTQIKERESLYVPRKHVKETPETLLQTGINTFQETLIVSKEKELCDVNVQLSEKRFNFEKIMSKYDKKRHKLMIKQEEFLNQIKGFNSFVEENTAKRRRALVKYHNEIRLLELHNNIYQEIEKDIENTKKQHEKLLNKVKRNKVYEDFLIKVIECLPQDYIKVTDNPLGGLIMRYNTLYSTNESLVSDMIRKSEESNVYIATLSKMKEEHENKVFHSNYKLSLLYEDHERLTDEIQKREQDFRIKYSSLREELLQFGLTLRAIDNISEKCARKFDETIIDTDFEGKIVKIQLEHKIKTIRDYIRNTRKIIEVVKQMKEEKPSIYLPQIPNKVTLTSTLEARQTHPKIRSISEKS